MVRSAQRTTTMQAFKPATHTVKHNTVKVHTVILLPASMEWAAARGPFHFWTATTQKQS
jgi:hypothetical protein